MVSEEVSAGWYEVAIDALMDFRAYPERGMAPRQKPWIDRLQEATEAREPITMVT
jgi:hypothetical protein